MYKKDTWIVEGVTTYLVSPDLAYADIIIHLGFQNLFSQWKSIIQRNQKRKDANFFKLLSFLIFVAQKRYGIGYKSNRVKRKEVLDPYKNKVIYLKSFKEIDSFLENIDIQ